MPINTLNPLHRAAGCRFKLSAAEAARQDSQRSVVNKEFVVFYGDDIDRVRYGRFLDIHIFLYGVK